MPVLDRITALTTPLLFRPAAGLLADHWKFLINAASNRRRTVGSADLVVTGIALMVLAPAKQFVERVSAADAWAHSGKRSTPASQSWKKPLNCSGVFQLSA